MARAGDMRKRTEVHTRTETRNAHGESEPTWTLREVRWCEVVPQSAREFYEARQIHADMTHLVTIRDIRDLAPEDRLVLRGRDGDRTIEILGVINVDERNQWTRIVGKERV